MPAISSAGLSSAASSGAQDCLCRLLSTLYPCYGAVRALESGHNSQVRPLQASCSCWAVYWLQEQGAECVPAAQLWLMYFLILSVFTFVENLLWPVLKWCGWRFAQVSCLFSALPEWGRGWQDPAVC